MATISIPEDLGCRFCGVSCKNDNSYRQHLIRCQGNPDRIEITSYFKHQGGGIPWNKGLSKENDKRVASAAINLSKTMKLVVKRGDYAGPCRTEFWSKDKRTEKSLEKKRLYEQFPEKHPNRKLAFNKSRISYPERVALEWLILNGIQFEHQRKIANFFVDFCIGNTILEIDGERWHPIGNEKDASRDLALTKMGFKIIRIRSKENIEEKLSHYFLGVGKFD